MGHADSATRAGPGARARRGGVMVTAVAATAIVTPSGCLTAGVTLGGAAQPALWDDTGLIRAAERLLHVKSVL